MKPLNTTPCNKYRIEYQLLLATGYECGSIMTYADLMEHVLHAEWRLLQLLTKKYAIGARYSYTSLPAENVHPAFRRVAISVELQRGRSTWWITNLARIDVPIDEEAQAKLFLTPSQDSAVRAAEFLPQYFVPQTNPEDTASQPRRAPRANGVDAASVEHQTAEAARLIRYGRRAMASAPR